MPNKSLKAAACYYQPVVSISGQTRPTHRALKLWYVCVAPELICLRYTNISVFTNQITNLKSKFENYI